MLKSQYLRMALLSVAAGLAGLLVYAIYFQQSVQTSPISKEIVFELQSVDRVLSEENLKGSYTIVFFGFTFCPDVCPTGLAKMRDVLNAVSSDRVKALFISVDPERDSVKRLAEYTQYFHSSILSATGNHEELASLTRQLGAFYQKDAQSDENYLVSHTASFYLLDQEARWIGRFEYNESTDAMIEQLKEML